MIYLKSNNSIYFNLNNMDTHFEDIYDLSNFTPNNDQHYITIYYKGVVPDYFIFEDKKYKCESSNDNYFDTLNELDDHNIKKILDLCDDGNYVDIYIKTNIGNDYSIYIHNLAIKNNDFLSEIELCDLSFLIRQNSPIIDKYEHNYIEKNVKIYFFPTSKNNLYGGQFTMRYDYEQIYKEKISSFYIDTFGINSTPTIYFDILFFSTEFQIKRKKLYLPAKYKTKTGHELGEVLCDVFITKDQIKFYILELKLPDLSTIQFKNTCNECKNIYPKHLQIADETKYRDICRCSLNKIISSFETTKYTRIKIEILQILDVLNITHKKNNVTGCTTHYKRI